MNNSNAWRLERDGEGIASLIIDRLGSSANTLSQSILLELETLLRELRAAPPSGVMIRSGKASGFIAGADIREFTAFRDPADAFEHIRIGQRIFDQLEALPCPTVAAISGFALGGGLELALACRYRVAVNDSRLAMGLPEVLLGIHPGFGGTVRAVRLLGVRQAMELMLTGKPLRADRVLQCGLVDRLVPAADLEGEARAILAERPALRRAPLADRLLGLPGVRQFLRGSLEARVARQARRDHYPAPYAIIDLWVRYGARGRAAFEAEAHSIARLFTHRGRPGSGAHVPAAGSAEGAGRQIAGAAQASACRGCRGHGRRYCRLVRAARSGGHAPGPGTEVCRARDETGDGAVCKTHPRSGGAQRGASGCAPTSPATASPRPMS